MRTKSQDKIPVFGRRMTALRKNRHLTQAELAREVGLSRQMVSYLESRAENPTLDQVKKLMDFFGVSADEFIIEEAGKTGHPGPVSKLDSQLDKIKKLPQAKQKMISNMLEGALQVG